MQADDISRFVADVDTIANIDAIPYTDALPATAIIMSVANREPIILEGLLSPQQYEVLRRVPSQNKQIARDLKISIGNVKNVLTMIYAKLELFGWEGDKRTRAMVVALECGLLILDEIIDGDARVEDDNGIY